MQEDQVSLPLEITQSDIPPIPEFPNLRPRPWTTADGNNPAPKHPTRKGTLNRKTIIKQALEMAASKRFQELHKEAGWEHPSVTLRDQMVASLVLKALSGDVAAINTLFDGEFGKLPAVTGDKPEGEKSHDEILRELLDSKGETR